MSRSASTPLVGHPGEGVPLSPKEKLKAKIDLLRNDPSNVYNPDVLVVGSGPIGAVFARKLERSDLFTNDEWEELYKEAETLFNTNVKTFNDSVRHRLVKKILQDTIDAEKADREVQSMPLACKLGKNKRQIDWSCTASILGDKLSNPDNKNDLDYSKLLTVLPQTQLDALYIECDGKGDAVKGAVIIDLDTGNEYLVGAKRYVICGGSVLTAGIVAQSLFKSVLEFKDEDGHIGASYLQTLGRYLTEQTMTFCQIVLKREYVQWVSDKPEELDEGDDDTIRDAVRQHKENHPDDPLPFPFDDLDPNIYTPFSEKYPWHTQIHRDAFGYGEAPADVDQRLIVDLRFFGYVDSNKYNKTTFSAKKRDEFGMPQPTFWFSLGKKDVNRSNRMMRDMVDVATSLGGFLPGAEPRHLAPGLALHVCGIYRAGKEVLNHDGKLGLVKTKDNSVVSKEGRVWGVSNLYLGGCGIIPTGNASNPTLTAACHAIAGADQIIKELDN
ncbi:Pyranose 2-oxidase [Cytospora mali]|uniref:Pyranose 2-oxidase n=1 Tax=Cytospora mali TaxID=578113 RepID=A0A194VK98_CYTMA|nr:Pyranose 2-oxidase [Valsa mali]